MTRLVAAATSENFIPGYQSHAASTAVRPTTGTWTASHGRIVSPGSGWAELYLRLRRDPEDQEAFASLTNRIAVWAKSQLGHAADRDDVVADTCSSVILGLDKAQGGATFAGFVYGHYLNARRHVRQAARVPTIPLDDLDVPEAPADGPNADELTLLERCLVGLPERERKAIDMRYFDGASAKVIASALGVSESNARRIVFNGLARLRRGVREGGPSKRG